MAERLSIKGVECDRIAIVRNWVDLDHVKPLVGPSAYRQELGLAVSDFVVLYSGNIGAKQGLDDLLATAKRLSSRNEIYFLIAGEGPAKADLRARCAEFPNVKFLPFQPYERFSQFLGLADLHILPQAADAADLVLPSKIAGMLASGRRIVAMAAAGTELWTFLHDAAVFVPPGDGAALADTIVEIVEGRMPDIGGPERRCRLAQRLSKADGLRTFESVVVRWDDLPLAPSLATTSSSAPIDTVHEAAL
jgi:colanic acid biosynthesis glycosyl transferase WcaI